LRFITLQHIFRSTFSCLFSSSSMILKLALEKNGRKCHK
jgi:hypothetical protein